MTLQLHVISHTHWDREWYQTFQQFRFRLVELGDRLLDLLERDPQFRFFHLDGQTIVLEDYSEVRPHRAAELRVHVAAGRVLVGPWYVQPDEFLVSGEAIVRNLLIGTAIARSWGASMPVGYLPDCFGHIAQMPQIICGFGIGTFVLARGVTPAQAGGTAFRWQGLDGSELFTAFLACWYNNAQRFPADSDAALAFVQQIIANLRAAGSGEYMLLMNGVDHLIAQEDLSPILQGLAERADGWQITHTTLPTALAAMQEAAGPELALLRGELRDETLGPLLTAVLSARVGLKQHNSRCERLLERWAEPLEALAGLLGKPYDRDYLRYAWKLLLQNHAHDSICGCSLDAVHAEMLPRFAQVEQVGELLAERAQRFVASLVDTSGPAATNALDSAALLVWNPLPRPRSEVAILEVDFAQRPEWGTVELLGPDGQTVPCQVLGRVQRTRKAWSPTEPPHEVPISRYTLAAFLEDVPPCGYRAYTARLHKGQPTQERSLLTEGGMANEHLHVTVAHDGTLAIRDAASGQLFERLGFFRDEGDVGDQYSFFKPLRDQAVETLGLGCEMRVLAGGPIVAEIEIVVRPQVPRRASADRQGRDEATVALPIRSRLRLCRGARHLAITTTLENTAHDHRLRAVFPLGAPLMQATADTAFGAVTRPAELPAFWPFASRDRPHRGFVDARNGERGLAVLSEGLYEHDVRPDGQVELTLLRAVGYMFVDVHTLEPLDATEDGQCPGQHAFAYGLLPHDGQLPLSTIAEAAACFQAPLRAWQEEHHRGELPAEAGFVSLEPESLQLSAVKFADDRDSLLIRCYNASALAVTGLLRVRGPWREAFLVGLDEGRRVALPLEADGAVTLNAGPWQIVSVELVPA